jgi:ABC-type nitrate/sulfonate/bicarbonate transport system substrate-binding protein
MHSTLISRRTAVRTAGIAMLAPAILKFGRSASAQSSQVVIAGVRDPQIGGQLAIAQEYKFFKEAGLDDVLIHWNQSSGDTLTLMAGGVGVGVCSTFQQVVFTGQNIPVRTISALADIAGTQGFALSPGVKLASPKELEGKKLAYTQGSAQILMLAKLAQLYKFDMAKVALINMEQSEGIVAAARGDVSGLLGWEPNIFRLIQMGGSMYATGSKLFVTGKEQELSFEDQLIHTHSIVCATNDWIKNSPNVLKAILSALQKATDLLANDRARALAAMQTVLKIDANALVVMSNANQYSLGITPELARSLAFQSEWALSIKRIKAPVNAEQAFAPEIIAAMDSGLVTWKPKS